MTFKCHIPMDIPMNIPNDPNPRRRWTLRWMFGVFIVLRVFRLTVDAFQMQRLTEFKQPHVVSQAVDAKIQLRRNNKPLGHGWGRISGFPTTLQSAGMHLRCIDNTFGTAMSRARNQLPSDVSPVSKVRASEEASSAL